MPWMYPDPGSDLIRVTIFRQRTPFISFLLPLVVIR